MIDHNVERLTIRKPALKVFALLLIAAVLVTSEMAASGQELKRAEALKKFLDAQRLDKTGDYPGAVAAYREAIGLDPTSAELRVALGSLYLRNRNIIEAEGQAREAIKLAPESLEGRKLLARVYLSQTKVGNATDKDKVQQAIKELEGIAVANPNADIEVGADQKLPAHSLIGELYLEIEDYDKALEAFKKASEGPGSGASSAPAYYRLAQIYFYQKAKYRDAAAAARKAYETDQKNPAFVSLLARSLLRVGRSQEAISVYQAAVGTKEAEGPAQLMVISPLLFDYAEALVMGGRYDEAVKLLEPHTKISRNNPAIFLRATEIIADAQRRAGKRPEAVKTIEEAIKGQDVSDSLPLLYNLAETYEEMQQFDKAVEIYDEALHSILNPDGTVSERDQQKQNVGLIMRRICLAYRMKGEREKVNETIAHMKKVLGASSPVPDQLAIGILLDEGRFKEALDSATAAATRYPTERSFSLYKAQAAGRLDDLSAAEATLRPLLKGGDEDLEIQLFLASIQLDANKLKEAEESAKKAVAIDPKDIGPLLTLSTIQDRQKKYKDSEATLRKALEIGPDNATVLNNLGYFLADRSERLNEAEELIRRAVNIEPTNGSFLDSLGWLLFRRGKVPESQKYLEQAVIYSPRSVTIHDHMGDVYKKLGLADKARAEWQMALKLGTELRFSTEPEEINRIKEKLGIKK